MPLISVPKTFDADKARDRLDWLFADADVTEAMIQKFSKVVYEEETTSLNPEYRREVAAVDSPSHRVLTRLGLKTRNPILEPLARRKLDPETIRRQAIFIAAEYFNCSKTMSDDEDSTTYHCYFSKKYLASLSLPPSIIRELTSTLLRLSGDIRKMSEDRKSHTLNLQAEDLGLQGNTHLAKLCCKQSQSKLAQYHLAVSDGNEIALLDLAEHGLTQARHRIALTSKEARSIEARHDSSPFELMFQCGVIANEKKYHLEAARFYCWAAEEGHAAALNNLATLAWAGINDRPGLECLSAETIIRIIKVLWDNGHSSVLTNRTYSDECFVAQMMAKQNITRDKIYSSTDDLREIVDFIDRYNWDLSGETPEFVTKTKKYLERQEKKEGVVRRLAAVAPINASQKSLRAAFAELKGMDDADTFPRTPQRFPHSGAGADLDDPWEEVVVDSDSEESVYSDTTTSDDDSTYQESDEDLAQPTTARSRKPSIWNDEDLTLRSPKSSAKGMAESEVRRRRSSLWDNESPSGFAAKRDGGATIPASTAQPSSVTSTK